MLAKLKSLGLHGIEPRVLDVEVDVRGGLPAVIVVGLPDKAVSEARDRVRAAVRNAGYEFPPRRITVNLAPADLRKQGAAYDLPIAVGVLAATGQIEAPRLGEFAVVGELALGGEVRRVPGILPMAIGAREHGFRGIIVPSGNVAEAAAVRGLEVVGVDSLGEAASFLAGEGLPARPAPSPSGNGDRPADAVDFAEVKGQAGTKRALLVAAAGGHNVLMVGPPGSGKSMLAKRIPTVLPPLSETEALETTKLYSIAGALPEGTGLLRTRPFRDPHHTVSRAGFAGGGANLARPGEISLAHHGVLFLDELPEFPRGTLEILRGPIEEGSVVIGRAAGSVRYPAGFMLVAAMNPCPCGYYTDPKRHCNCDPTRIQNYLGRVSGPLLDRIDLHVEVPAVPYEKLRSDRPEPTSADLRKQVLAARARQRARFGDDRKSNARMGPTEIRDHCRLDTEGEGLLRRAMESMELSARAYHRILKVSRTIADLAGADGIAPEHVAEAVQYRTLDRAIWGT